MKGQGERSKEDKKKKGGNGICIYVYAVRKQKRERKDYQPFSAFFSLRYSMILSPVNSSRTCTM